MLNYLDSTFVVFVKYDSIEQAEKEWRVILFEQSTSYEEHFSFQTCQILTKDEQSSLNPKNDRIMKDIVSKVVDKRLKLKQIEDKFAVVKEENLIIGPDNKRKRYLVYFIDPSGTATETKKEMHNFDIRFGFRFSLTNPESLIPEGDAP